MSKNSTVEQDLVDYIMGLWHMYHIGEMTRHG